MRNAEVASVLNEYADLLELRGEDRYRIARYRDAATRIEHHPEPIEDLVRDGRVREIRGVGESIGAKVIEYIQTGKIQALEDLRKEVSPAAAMLMNIPGIGPRRAMLLTRELRIQTVADLERALESGEVARLPRLGARVAERILEEVRRLRTRGRRMPLGLALPAAEEMARELRQCPAVLQVTPAGSIRRMKETIGDIDLLVTSERPADVIEAFVTLPAVREVLAAGETKASILTHADLQIDLRVVAPESYGAALLYFTGSKAHNIRLREIAIEKGWKLNEYGVFEDDRRIAGRTEEEVYGVLGLPWIPPELREDMGEVEAALRGELPSLVALEDIEGDLHTHTRLSDGSSDIEEMARAAARRGYAYLAITDHSQALGVARGLTEDELRQEHARIRELQASFPETRLLCGVEVDIRVDSRLDCSDEFLASCDVVVASIHSAFQRSREEQTARLIAAIEHPYVDIICHPTGRLIGKRAGYDIDLGAVLETAARTGTAIEVNAQPDRLDLNDDAIRAAVQHGVMLVIDTDAHHHDQLDLMRYGVATARRGWAPPELVLNTRPLDDLLRWLRERRERALRGG